MTKGAETMGTTGRVHVKGRCGVAFSKAVPAAPSRSDQLRFHVQIHWSMINDQKLF